MSDIDWRGWLIVSTCASAYPLGLYVCGELPSGALGWTADKSKALGFRKKAQAQEWIDKNGLTDVQIKFHPWRRAPT